MANISYHQEYGCDWKQTGSLLRMQIPKSSFQEPNGIGAETGKQSDWQHNIHARGLLVLGH